MQNNTKLWLTVKEFAPFYGKKPAAIYMQIARGRFPFRYRRCNGDSGSILISARDAEVVQPNEGREVNAGSK